jgi:VWFA-related protein
MTRPGNHTNVWLYIGVFVLASVFLFSPTHSLAKTAYDLVIHHITPAPAADGGTDVRVFLSVWDEDRKMAKDLEVDDFTVSENGKSMQVKSLEQVRDEPLSVMLLLDASGNTVRVNEEREAGVDFVKGLNRIDFAGALSFADEVKTEVEISDDHDKIQDKIGRIKSVPEAGNCFYDAAYEGVKQIAKQSGRRVIILINDSEDKAYKSNKSCSSNTEEDVIESATDWNTRVPIFTVGVGQGADEKSLQRLAEKTGGRYIYVENSGDIKDALNDFSNLFQNEYILTYNTPSKPGSYTLVVEVEHKSTTDSDTRAMEITEEGGAAAPGEQPAQTSPQTPQPSVPAPTVPALPTLPFEATLPVSQPEAGEISILSGSNPLVLLGIVAIVAALVLLLVVLGVGRRILSGSKKKATAASGQIPASPSPDVTVDSFPPVGSQNGLQIGSLTVLASDDAAMIGKVLIVNGGRTSVGRSSENDIVLAGDKAVSREHALIEQSGEHVFLAEVVSQNPDRSVKRPVYGTFVNETKVEGVPVELHTGDEIRLGTRMKMRFEKLAQSSTGGDATLDEVNISSPDSAESGGGETVEYRQ